MFAAMVLVSLMVAGPAASLKCGKDQVPWRGGCFDRYQWEPDDPGCPDGIIVIPDGKDAPSCVPCAGYLDGMQQPMNYCSGIRASNADAKMESDVEGTSRPPARSGGEVAGRSACVAAKARRGVPPRGRAVRGRVDAAPDRGGVSPRADAQATRRARAHCCFRRGRAHFIQSRLLPGGAVRCWSEPNRDQPPRLGIRRKDATSGPAEELSARRRLSLAPERLRRARRRRGRNGRGRRLRLRQLQDHDRLAAPTRSLRGRLTLRREAASAPPPSSHPGSQLGVGAPP
jgi:hypothetical protein